MSSSITWHPGHEEVLKTLADRLQPVRVGDAIMVPTDVMLFNGNLCMVFVEGGAAGAEITVTDCGAALNAVFECGLELPDPAARTAKRAARKAGVTLEFGVIRSDPVPLNCVQYAVSLVATAMKDVSIAAYESAKKYGEPRFREKVATSLKQIFHDATVLKGPKILVSSEDELRFDYSVSLLGNNSLVIDAPLPDLSSVASVVLRQTDLKQAALPRIRQAIIYDDNDRWSSIGLSQLRLAKVPVIPARSLESGLKAAAN